MNVLLTRLFPKIAEELLLQAGLSVTAWGEDRPMSPAELRDYASRCDAMLCASSDILDADFFEASPHLQIVSQFSAGYDNIALKVATRLGIPVCNAPGAMSEATADVAFGLILAVARNMFQMHKTIEENQWGYFRPRANLGQELRNKTLGIFGLGRIGFALAQRCKGAYQMNILYYNRRPNPEAEYALQARYVPFEILLEESDIISVHTELNESSHGLFDQKAFARMKRTAIFINTSRGAVHREEDLIRALEEKSIWGAGLDVTNPEPMHPDNPLLRMANVAVLPHIGSATTEARDAMGRIAAENLIAFHQNAKLPFLLNPEVYVERRGID